uniref:Uncharacterized protein n=1 Tax=Oryza sativa subsp. japonica TaxID=39947 RepID=Q656B5_ORYSJ|nr:hypothetical protein [Oryza sativa Japonica Group]BAD45352.1 hypothetical protein [Oryza sativa Japonica Group]
MAWRSRWRAGADDRRRLTGGDQRRSTCGDRPVEGVAAVERRSVKTVRRRDPGGGAVATSLAQWLGQRSTGWTGTAMRRKAALWTSGATTSSTQGVRPVRNEISKTRMYQAEVVDHVLMDEMRRSSLEKSRNGSNMSGLKIEKQGRIKQQKIWGLNYTVSLTSSHLETFSLSFIVKKNKGGASGVSMGLVGVGGFESPYTHVGSAPVEKGVLGFSEEVLGVLPSGTR